MIRAAVWGALAALMSGAVWLYAVRGEAIWMDLRGMAGMVCL